MNEDRRLIEESLPIKEISEESSIEKRSKTSPGHIYSLHIWWARRPLIAARAAVFGALIKISKNQNEVQNLKEQIIELCKRDSMNNASIINDAKSKILKSNNNVKPKVLDCFAGGGSIPLEALRLSCETYALDLNPVAHLIELCTLVYPQKYGKPIIDKNGFAKIQNKLAFDVEKWGKWVLGEAKKEIGEFYPNDPDGSVPIAYLWARTVKCPNPSCGAEIPLIKQYWLCKKSNKKVSLKPIVNKKENEVDFEIVEGKKIDFKPEEGTMKKGSATCLLCGGTAGGKYIRKESQEGRMDQRMTAVVLTYPKKTGKIYRLATQKDFEVFKKASKELEKYKGKKIKVGKQEISLIPDEPLPPEGSLGISPYWTNKKGENRNWAELFNDRQLLSIIIFLLKIREIKDKIVNNNKDPDYCKAVITYLSFVMDKYIDKASSLIRWNNIVEKVENTFGRQALQMIWDYGEVNPFTHSAGNWNSAVKRIKEVIEKQSKIESPCEQVIMDTATDMPFDDGSFDAVITDPPYYDAVPYSDLSDFFYIWLKRSIGDLYPNQFGMLLTPKSSEIIQTLARHSGDKEKAKKWYEEQMTLAFKECNRVLKENGIFVVVFAHKTTSAWETLVSSLLNSNLVVTSSWPLKTEMQTRMRAKESAALASSIFIVCRKRLTSEEGYFNEIKDDLKEKIYKKLDEFWKQGIRGADFFISAIGPAVEVFGKYKKVKKLSGEEVTVAELLNEVISIVTDYSLHKILKDGHLGNIDEITRFYVLWRWAYGDADVPYDDARKLAQALGTEPDELLSKKGLLNKKGDKVNMLEPWERKDEHLGESKHGMPAPMVDVIHRACKLIDKNEDISKFIEESGYAKDESIKKVIQAIAEILPEGDKERRLLQILSNKLSSSSLETNRFKSQTRLESYKGERK